MQTLTPSPVLELLVTYLSHKSWRVREELVNVVIIALSTFPRDQFDFAKLTNDLLPALRDSNARVKFVGVEAYAVIHNLVGAKQLRTLLQSCMVRP